MRSIPVMPARAVRLVAAGALLCLAPAAGAAEDDIRFSISLGGQLVRLDEDDERDSKFQEYRDVPQAAIVDEFRFAWLPEASPWSLVLEGLNVLRLDQRYELTFGKADRFQAYASWTEIPHFFARDATFLEAGGGGDFTLSNDFRQVLEDDSLNGMISTVMPEVLATTAHPLDVRLRRERADAGIRLPLGAGWELSVSAAQAKWLGESRISTGSYIRTSTASSFDAEEFEIRGFEMPESMDRTVTEAALDAGFHRKRGFFTFGYQLADFQNDIPEITWDNPFEASPSASSSSLGLFVGADQEPSAAQGNTSGTFNRARFAEGRLDLYPDNLFQRVHGSGAVNLPGRTRISAAVSLGQMEQDDAFLPYTVNEAICFNAGADNVCGTGDAGEVLAADQPLPQASLDGEIRTLRTAVRITSRPVKPLTLRGSWLRYDYDDRTEELLFPGYAAAGESYFRPGIGQRDASNTRVLIAEFGGYTRSILAVGAAWRIVPVLLLDVELSGTVWDYDDRQVDETEEGVVAAKLQIDPVDWFQARLSWLDGSRTFDGDYEVGFETSGVRAFDVWDRDRTRYGVEVDFLPGDAWTVGAAWTSWRDDYPGSVESVTPYPYGLDETASNAVSLYLGYGAAGWDVGATVGTEDASWDSLSVTKTSFSGVNYDPNNRWTRSEDDDLLWGSVWFQVDMAERKVRLSGEVTVSRYEGDLDTENVATPNVNSAVAYPFPEFEEDLLSARVAALWRISRHLAFEARAWYEPYQLDDFMWDTVQPYMQGVVTQTGTSPTDIQAANVNRLLLLDSRYSDYSAAVLYAGVRLTY
jgi:hypothetical protein